MDLTNFNWASAGFIATTLDDSHHYEKDGLILYVTYVALISTLLNDCSVFQLPKHFEAEIGYNEEGAYIQRSSKEVAENYIREVMIKQQQYAINLTEWDANAELGRLMEGTPAKAADIKATFIELKPQFSYHKKSTNGVYTYAFTHESGDVVTSFASGEPDFQFQFTNAIKQLCSVEQ